jgi:hypothetical protein
MPNYDRLSIVVSLVLLGLALTLVIGLPTRYIDADLLGSPVRIELGKRLVMSLLLGSLTAVGVEYIMRAHPKFGTGGLGGYSFLFWILPTLATLAATWFTPTLYDNQGGLLLWLAGLGVAALLLAGLILAEYRTIDPEDPANTMSRLLLNLFTYLSALVLFTAVYEAKLRSLLSASLVALFAGILALALLRAERSATYRTWSLAAVCGLVLGQATWALNYWGIKGLAGGGLLLLAFYFFGGLSQQRILNRFSRLVLLEFAVVGGIGLAVLANTGALSW